MRRIVLTIDIVADDNRSLPGFPKATVRYVEAAHTCRYAKAADGLYAPLPSGRVGVARLVAFKVDAACGLKLNAQISGAIPLVAGAVVVGFGMVFDGGAYVHATIKREGDTAANVVGLVGGDMVGPETGYGEGGYGEGGYGGKPGPSEEL